jgi:DNA repair exonuclease SbcCD ATPase subunit
MQAVLPQPHEAQQLCRLRGLRVQRAQEACTKAQAEVDAAARKVRDSEQAIERTRTEIDTLSHAIVNALAPHLPRWATMATAQRDRLADKLERAEYALIDDEQALEEARERLAQARTALTRAQASEDAVKGLAKEAKQALALAREQRADIELEDQGARRAAPTRSTPR